MPLILTILVGYLLGSIPFGLLLARANGIDLRSVGSGNIGATNVLRTGDKRLAAATLLLDAGKGALAVWLAMRFGDASAIPVAAGAAAFVGHVFPVWLKFRGGKGVATLLGVTLAVLPVAALVFGVVWLAVAVVTRLSSLGGMLAAIAVPATAWGAGRLDLVPWLAGMVVLLLIMHRENIGRLRAGTESRIGAKP
ncbi:glycerol-3-phosphate 1-O-acyltransferase PlsY [Glacieibacterium frigidum]|uniref:Glycerol-3-phosphate acyltransferase n=1 Tax=Glacieibacterium frigidum TaxID=2593303 RepID=A0A552UAK6_9SPHN|nr:glycerol-3-phosphate 1-O-acyltransferase PlsY [Glacieibacterium frigidum]TRW15229.1 glycerol-3-phosphate 1-O-acyltransferase PlsY [Glacieibacterium frigidum]